MDDKQKTVFNDDFMRDCLTQVEKLNEDINCYNNDLGDLVEMLLGCQYPPRGDSKRITYVNFMEKIIKLLYAQLNDIRDTLHLLRQ